MNQRIWDAWFPTRLSGASFDIANTPSEAENDRSFDKGAELLLL
jgi:hypothetical protein